jgi:four helix bundle protein
MTIKPLRNPYGYRNLLAYTKADELQSFCMLLTSNFPYSKTLVSLADQMNRSARSTKQNIVEGWKRNSTKEYYEFLGFSIGSNTELEEDATDIWKGHYPDLVDAKGVMGEKGIKGGEEKRVMAERGVKADEGKGTIQEKGIRGREETQGVNGIGKPLSPFNPLNPIASLYPPIETIPFYPLDPMLPPAVQLKLRAKELNFLLDALQKSLVEKMTSEQTLPASERMRISDANEDEGDLWLAKEREKAERGKGEEKGKSHYTP